jgi:hypothetical protein
MEYCTELLDPWKVLYIIIEMEERGPYVLFPTSLYLLLRVLVESSFVPSYRDL